MTRKGEAASPESSRRWAEYSRLGRLVCARKGLPQGRNQGYAPGGLPLPPLSEEVMKWLAVAEEALVMAEKVLRSELGLGEPE